MWSGPKHYPQPWAGLLENSKGFVTIRFDRCR
jgi:hypothetical protein